jgi:flagellar biosynthesis protein FlhG
MTGLSQKGRTIAITSGKGGVGKTVITANLACALVQRGQRVLILDADLGLANLDIILNLNPEATLHDVMVRDQHLEDVILEGPQGLHILPAASGKKEYTQLTQDLREGLQAVVSTLCEKYDYLFLDTGAGISDVVLHTASLAEETLVVATPSPTSLTDAYATIKVLAYLQNRSSFYLVANQVVDESNGEWVSNQLQKVADQFLKEELSRSVSLMYLGSIPSDAMVEKSVCQRQLLLTSFPETPASKGIMKVAQSLEASSHLTGSRTLATHHS